MSNSAFLSSSLAKKYAMAFTGLFLCLFLVIHLLGNLQLMFDPSEAKNAFNAYTFQMTHNPLIKVASYITYFAILFHTVDGIILTSKNKKSRPEKYAFNRPSANSSWASRNMGLLGILLLFYIVSHMSHFWWQVKFGDLETYLFEGNQIQDIYTPTILFFKNGVYGLIWTIVYVVSMVVIALHLAHGFQSAFQSLGLHHARYTPIIKAVGMFMAIAIPAGFAFIPFYIRFIL
jgi:succinate dehydrogenase / fumarate reductase, cytochrome b subunit